MDIIELHIWGPAFGLPSIDPECIAATAYLKAVLLPERWRLVVNHDLSISPNGNFPCLRHGHHRVAGFNALVKYLKQRGFDLDDSLEAQQRPDSLALLSHFATHALPLLDATLYSSSTNYAAATRKAFTLILPTHANYIIPPARQTLAEARTVPLGLAVDELPQQDHFNPQSQFGQEARMVSSSPSLIFKGRQKVTAALSQQQTRARIRIEGLLSNLAKPLEARLRDDGVATLLHTSKPTSIDCLAFGYLSLLLYPDLPNPWVSESLQARHKRIVEYTDSLRQTFFSSAQFDPSTIMQDSSNLSNLDSSSHSGPGALPWRTATYTGVLQNSSSLLLTALHHLVTPSQQALYAGRKLLSTSKSITPPGFPYLASASFGVIVSFVGLIVGSRLRGSPFGERDKYIGPPRPRIESMGAAGSALAALL